MKRQFQSKAVPRGTRTIWRYLSALIILFTFAVGNVWADDYILNASTFTDQISATVDGQTFTLDQAHGGTGQTGYGNYIKFSRNKTYVMTLPEGFALTNINIKGYTNSNGKTDGEIVKIGGNDQSGKTFPAKNDANLGSKTQITDGYDFAISQTGGTVAIKTANTNQICVLITITGTPASSGTDETAPTFASSVPANGAIDVETSGTIVLTFSEDIANIDDSKFSLSGATIGTVAIDGTDATKVNVPYTGAANSATVTLSVAAGAVEDAAGNALEDALSDISFTTKAAAVPTAPSFTSPASEPAAVEYHVGDVISALEVVAAGYPAPTLQWYSNDSKSTTGATLISGEESASYTPSNAAESNLYYYCVASNASGDAQSEYFHVTVLAAAPIVCPESGIVYTMTMKSKSLSGVTQNTEVALVAGDYATEDGGTAYLGNKNSDAGKAQIKTDGGGTVYYNGNDAYVKIELDCPLKADDKITFVPGSGTRQLCFTTSNTRTTTYQTSSNSFAITSEFLATAADADNVKTIYVWRIGSSTYLHSLTITRPYTVSYDNLKEASHTMPAKAIKFTLEELTNATFEHTGWTADKAVKVGGDTKAAGTALAVDAEVELTDNTTFTATWEAKVTKYTVTYYDGEAIEANKLGSELVNEGSNPTGAGLAPKKQGFTFSGWSTTEDGAAVALNTINVAANMPLYAVWTAVDCPTKGTVFSFEMNNDAKPSGDVKAPAKGTLVIDEYLTISGSGSVIIGNTTNNTNQYSKVTSTPNVNLSGATGYLRLAMDCQLAAGDVITIAKNNTQIYISDEAGTSGPTGNKYTTASNSENTIVVGANETTAEWVGSRDLYFWYKGGGVNITAVSVVRPYTVSFNLNGQSATAIADQKVVAGGKVTEPTAPVVTGQAFGGWYKEAACTNAWDFTNDVVNDDVELFAKWTALKSMTLSAGEGTGDDIVSYPTVGDPVAVPACPAAFEKTGYIFAGWTYSPSVTVEGGQFTMPNEDLTLTAQWDEANKVAKIGDVKYETLEDALLHAADGTIELLQDINVEAQVEIADGVSATIDLAGHKIEYTGTSTLASGVILVHNGGSLTINDSSDPDAGSVVAGEKAYAALMMTKAGDDASKVANLTINGGSFTGYYYAISGNGNRPNTNITINGGTFTATAANDNLAIYHPQNGTLTINGGSFEGYLSAIEMRAGSLVINDGSFTATAPTFSCNAAGSGTTTQGAAIAIAQHTTKKDIEVTINGGTFTGVKALNESNPQANDPAPQVTMAVTAGTFTGEVSTVDVDKFVSGGSFSEPVAEANCATGYVPETKANGKYGVIVPAQSIDFMAIIDAKGTGDAGKAELDGQLASKHYDIDGTLNNDRLDGGSGADKGFKVKVKDLTISFSVEAGKVVEITTGHISGASIKVDAEDAVALATSQTYTYYSDDAQAFLITMTTGSYNIFKSINIRDPYEVTFDGNGGTPAVASLKGTLSVTLPTSTKGTDHFIGWYDIAEEEGSTLIGLAGAEYTPTSDITLYAHYAAQSNDATLASWEIDGVDTPVPTEPGNLIHRIEVPYGTAVSALPKITAAVAHDATYAQSVVIYPTDGPEWQAGIDGGCYVQQVIVTAEDGTQGFYHVRTKILPKDMACLIKATVTGDNAMAIDASASIYEGTESIYRVYGNAETYEAKSAPKFQSDGYLGVTLTTTGAAFQEGDVVRVFATKGIDNVAKLYVYSDNTGTAAKQIAESETALVKGYNEAALTAAGEGATSVFLCRAGQYTSWNPCIYDIAVYRAYPNPLVNTITFNGAAGTVDNDLKTITVEVPATTDLATMPVVASFLSNDPSQTNGAVTGGTWVEGDNEYIVTDKDNDQTVYTVTITKAVPSNDATLETLTYGTPATAITLADGVFEYNVELPYGTSAVPALAATAHHAGASVTNITDATAFVNRHATSIVTVTAEDNTTTQLYTVNFTISAWKEVVIWDGSNMTAVAASPDATTGLAWAATGFGSIGSYTTTYGEKSYSKYLPSGGAATSRYMTLTVPAGYVAKFYVVMASHSAGNERGMFIGSNLVKDPDATSVLELSNSSRTEAVAGMSEIVGAGTWYINPNASIDFQEIRAYVRKGMVRNSMLGNGVLGTSCVDHNVAIEDIQGATFYELIGRDYNNYGKLAFDEIVSGELDAGVPYLFQAHGDKMILFYGEDVEPSPVDKGNGMYGTFEQVVFSGDQLSGIYYFAQRALWSCDGAETLTIPANRAYVKLSEIGEVPSSNPAPGRRRVLMNVNGEKNATGFENIEASEKPMKIMINGKIFILRGEKMFDATGRLVK